mmetsp:Transcript_51058/g.163351  ORF Transcript_51058/g.163351 Transcript_51058/m.163351 type:complete len:281 (+) Transcript_51058:862-1704(+)
MLKTLLREAIFLEAKALDKRRLPPPSSSLSGRLRRFIFSSLCAVLQGLLGPPFSLAPFPRKPLSIRGADCHKGPPRGVRRCPGEMGVVGDSPPVGTTVPSGSIRILPRSAVSFVAHLVALSTASVMSSAGTVGGIGPPRSRGPRPAPISPNSPNLRARFLGKKAHMTLSPANLTTSPPCSSTTAITREKRLFMHRVRSSTPDVPRLDKVSVRGVNPEMSATMITASMYRMVGRSAIALVPTVPPTAAASRRDLGPSSSRLPVGETTPEPPPCCACCAATC